MSGRAFQLFEGVEVMVPEGHWVLPGITTAYSTADDHHEGYEVVGGSVAEHIVEEVAGHDFSEIDGDYWGSQELLLVSPKPFGALTWYGDKYDVGRRLQLARQIHKGELGQYVEVPLPGVVRLPGKKRHGWCRIGDVAAMASMEIKSLLENYWPVIDYDADSPQGFIQPRIDLVQASEEEIKSGKTRSSSVPRSMILDWFVPGHNHNWEQTWIRRGTARTILYLAKQGHVFEPLHSPA